MEIGKVPVKAHNRYRQVRCLHETELPIVLGNDTLSSKLVIKLGSGCFMLRVGLKDRVRRKTQERKKNDQNSTLIWVSRREKHRWAIQFLQMSHATGVLKKGGKGKEKRTA